MNIAITGSSGFIANALKGSKHFSDTNFIALSRHDDDEKWEEIIKNANVVINLAGASVIKRWSKHNKTEILKSRIDTTRKLVSIMNKMPKNKGPKLFISGSAIGIYPDNGNELLDERSTQRGESFLSEVVEKWESEANELTASHIRLVITRIGVVLGKNGGLLKKILPLFKLGLGGKIGNGHQAFSFIHINDLVLAIRFFIDNAKTSGTYNLVSPNNTTNINFTKAMGKALHKPTLIPVPAFALGIIYGKAARIMVNGEKVYPARLLNDGFVFKYTTIEQAVENIIEELKQKQS